MKINPYLWFAPICVCLFDHEIERIYKRAEYAVFLWIKIVAWAVAGGIYIIAAIGKDNHMYKITNILLIVYPFYAYLYSFLIYKCKCLTRSIDDGGNRIEDLENRMEEQVAQIEQRQANFDMNNFGGEVILEAEIERSVE